MSWKIALEDERYYANAESMPGAQKALRLAAAAPELLEAVQYALDVSAEGLRLGEEWQFQARAVIAKAKGEEQ